jgi:hypothetical protein
MSGSIMKRCRVKGDGMADFTVRGLLDDLAAWPEGRPRAAAVCGTGLLSGRSFEVT